MPQTIQVARRRKWFPTWILLALAMTHSTNLYWKTAKCPALFWAPEIQQR